MKDILGSLNKNEVGVMMSYQNYIEISPGKRGGKPCLKGMRISVSDVLGWLASGMSEADVMEDFPEVTSEHIRACLAYAADREHHQLSVA
ncbi:MAG: DUF433 domain-containing protein [Halioglobus sp.]|nr:DUF433 domain-containing protein [Halioglobus sp.]